MERRVLQKPNLKVDQEDLDQALALCLALWDIGESFSAHFGARISAGMTQYCTVQVVFAVSATENVIASQLSRRAVRLSAWNFFMARVCLLPWQ